MSCPTNCVSASWPWTWFTRNASLMCILLKSPVKSWTVTSVIRPTSLSAVSVGVSPRSCLLNMSGARRLYHTFAFHLSLILRAAARDFFSAIRAARRGVAYLRIGESAFEANFVLHWREQLHDEDAVPGRSRRIHHSIPREEVLDNDRRDHNVRRGVHLGTDCRPSLHDEGVLKSAEALIVPKFQWEGRIRRVAEPHRPDARQALVRRNVPRAERPEQGERSELLRRRDVFDAEDCRRVPRHRRRREERREEPREKNGLRRLPWSEPSPCRDERHTDQDRERVVEKVDGAVDNQETFRIQAAQ